MLKYALVSLLFVLPFCTVSTPSADAGLFKNRPVRTFFQNRRPVRKLLKVAKVAVVAPVKAVACACGVNCQCVDCDCPPVSSTSDCVNCGTEE